MPQIPARRCADLGNRGARLAGRRARKAKRRARLVKKCGARNPRHGYRRAQPNLIIMATLTDRLPQNVPGRFYVDASCIDCDQCRAIAPQFFARDENTGFSYVQQQPVTADEITEVEQIMVDCSVASIGNDGA
jgi:ferredoxin